MFRIESRPHRVQPLVRAQQQPGRGDHDERNSDLTRDERAAESVLTTADRTSPASLG
jgi:hypothetical protein